MELEVSQATLAFLAAYRRLIQKDIDISEVFIPLFNDKQYSLVWDLIGYTANFSEIDTQGFESDFFHPVDNFLSTPFFINAISEFSGEEFELTKFRETPAKWYRIFANYFYGLPLGHSMKTYQFDYMDYLGGWSTESKQVFYQCHCSVILGTEFITHDFGSWYSVLRPKTTNVIRFRLYDLLITEVNLIRDHFLVPVSLTALEWIKTDEVVKPPADPIKVLVLNKWLTNYFVLVAKVSPSLLEKLRLAGVFDV